MRKKLYIFGIIIVCNSFYSFAQEPASMKWKQVNTSVFQLVFPEHYDSVARRIGTMLMIENPFETHSMQCVPKKITVILHNQSNMSNSWVALGPRRVELFHTPPQTTISPMDWNGALVLHEFRHVIQYQMLKKGFAGKLLYIYMGDIGLGLKSLTSPEWFYEGDAVATETALSYAGRGRSPDFSKDLRAQLLDKRKYSYAKAVCGSYKDYVPNHYVLGYHLVSYGRSVWSADLWRTAHKNSGNVIGLTPFSTGIKKVTGMRKYAFYNTALADLKTYWGNQLQRQKAFPFETITIPQKTTYTDYTYPQKLADKSIIALKSGMGDIPTIVKISPEGDETVIREVATITDGNPVHTNGAQITWVEGFDDLRWTNRSFSDVMLFDMENNTLKRMSHKQHYYASDISPDGLKIIAVEVTEKALYKLVLLDAKTGRIFGKISSPQNEFILTPHWANDNKTVTCILLGKNGKSLNVLNSETGLFTKYSPSIFTDISEAFLYKHFIVYTSEHNGINNEIYAFDTITKKCFQLTNTRFGSRFASVSKNNELLFSTYTAKGYMLCSQTFDERVWKKSDFSNPPTDTLVQGLLKDELGVPPIFDTTKVFDFHPKPYRKGLHMFCPHSWGVGVNTNNSDSKTNLNDVSIISQDKLGTMEFAGGYRYDYIGTKKWYATLFYTGMYPVIQLDFEKGTNGYLSAYQQAQKTLTYDTIAHQDGSLLRQIVTFPFDISTSNYFRYFEISFINRFDGFGSNHLEIVSDNQFHILGSNHNYIPIQNEYFKGYTDYISVNFTYSNTKYSPLKNLYPSWGQTFECGYFKYIPIVKTIDNTFNINAENQDANSSSYSYFVNYENRFYAKAGMYLPGFFKHHGIYLSAGFTQTGEVKNSYFPNNPIDPIIAFARGYIDYSGIRYKSYGSFSANYAFTVANPDFSIPSIVFLKRITANIFYDRSIVSNENLLQSPRETFTSFGAEIISENHALNIPNAPIFFGLRISSIDPLPLIGQTRRMISQIIFVYSL